LQAVVEEDRMARSWKVPIVTRQTGAAPAISTLVAGDPGAVTFALTPCESLYNPIGMVHGGVTATLLDSAMGCAVHSELPAGAGYTTLELKANYLRPITADTGPVRCRARVVHRGGTVATAEARAWREADNELLAHATTTCLVLGGRNGRKAVGSSRSAT
jgi:uncharacterized protein (TIGR00369 family)